MPGTILLGIDVESANGNTLAFLEHGRKLFKELSVPTTWFVTGGSMENYPDEFRAVEGDPLVDIQGHTYSHMLLKTVFMQPPEGLEVHGQKGWLVVKGGSPQEVDEDLARCQDIFEEAIGRRATAMTTPWAYYRGLGDRPDLLEIVHKHGFRAIRSWGRDEKDCQPTPLELKPFFYEAQGFPDILECFLHDYQDDFYWKMFALPGPNDTYAGHLKQVADRVAREDLVWSLCSHDHRWADPEGLKEKLGWMRPMLEHALGLGIRFLTISEYYEEKVSQRP